MKLLLLLTALVLAVIVAADDIKIPYTIQSAGNCTPGKKFVATGRSKYVFLCSKTADGRLTATVAACRDYEGNELAVGAKFNVNGVKYHCYKNSQGTIESDVLRQ